jgi:LacI family transcriptional regulator
MAPETPLARDAVRGLRARGIPVATLGSDLPASDRDRFVGIDGRAAGRTAGLLMARFLRGPARVLALAPSMLLRDSIERRRGFDEVMAAEAPEVEVLQTLETHGSAAVMSRVVGAVLGQGVTPGGIYLLGEGHGALAATLRGATLPERPVVIGHELTPDARAALLGGQPRRGGGAERGPPRAQRPARPARARGRRPVDTGQDSLRVEIVTRENLPPEA